MEQIITQIEAYMQKCGGRYGDWYAGIAADPTDRLFNAHGVRKDSDPWIHHECHNETQARQVEDYLLKRGCQGGPGGGDSTTRHVYAYKVKPHTREN